MSKLSFDLCKLPEPVKQEVNGKEFYVRKLSALNQLAYDAEMNQHPDIFYLQQEEPEDEEDEPTPIEPEKIALRGMYLVALKVKHTIIDEQGEMIFKDYSLEEMLSLDFNEIEALYVKSLAAFDSTITLDQAEKN